MQRVRALQGLIGRWAPDGVWLGYRRPRRRMTRIRAPRCRYLTRIWAVMQAYDSDRGSLPGVCLGLHARAPWGKVTSMTTLLHVCFDSVLHWSLITQSTLVSCANWKQGHWFLIRFSIYWSTMCSRCVNALIGCKSQVVFLQNSNLLSYYRLVVFGVQHGFLSYSWMLP